MNDPKFVYIVVVEEGRYDNTRAHNNSLYPNHHFPVTIAGASLEPLIANKIMVHEQHKSCLNRVYIKTQRMTNE